MGGTGVVTFSQCHFDAWDNYLSTDGKSFTHNGTAAINQQGGALIVTMTEFSGHDAKPMHLDISPGAAKTIFTNNIVKGELNIRQPSKKGKVIIANNADDSADGSEGDNSVFL